MAMLIDASVLIAIERERLGLETVLEEHGEEAAAIAAITASELLHGVHRARTTKQRARREAFVEQVLTNSPCCLSMSSLRACMPDCGQSWPPRALPLAPMICSSPPPP